MENTPHLYFYFCGQVWSPTGPVNRDYDDVRRYQDAALAGIKR